MDAIIQQSLKKLYLQLKTDRARFIAPNIETKTLMRDAPDVEERANYQPRHPSQLEKKPSETQKPLKPVTLDGVEDPDLVEEDTRPTRTVAAIQPEALAEPSFLAGIPSDALPPDKRETDEHKRVEVEALSHAQPIDVSAITHELAGSTTPAPPIDEAGAADSLTAAPTQHKRPQPASASQTSAPGPAPVIAEPLRTDSERITDTSKVSIWEVFGLPRPSESQVIAPLSEPPKAPAPPKPRKPIKAKPDAPKAPPPPPIKAARTPPPRPTAAAAPDLTLDEPPALHLDDLELPSLRLGMRRTLRRQQVKLRRLTL
jgi:hypothetical protein